MDFGTVFLLDKWNLVWHVTKHIFVLFDVHNYFLFDNRGPDASTRWIYIYTFSQANQLSDSRVCEFKIGWCLCLWTCDLDLSLYGPWGLHELNAEAFRWSGGMLDTFSNWMDRVWVQNRPAISQDRSVNKNCPELHLASPAANKVLALLMEVPGSLMPQTRKAFCVSKTWWWCLNLKNVERLTFSRLHDFSPRIVQGLGFFFKTLRHVKSDWKILKVKCLDSLKSPSLNCLQCLCRETRNSSGWIATAEVSEKPLAGHCCFISWHWREYCEARRNSEPASWVMFINSG